MAAGVAYAVGAEAILYRIDYYGLPAILKIRVSKPYRHPVFDKLFRYRRTVTEARVLSHLYLLGLNVPALYYVDPDNYLIVMEYISGCRLSDCLGSLNKEAIRDLALELGRQAATIHSNGIYHGDFTIANIIVRDNKPYIIDFGLSGYSWDVEEYAIDIHLLDRSIYALYPVYREFFMENFWRGYKSIVGIEKQGLVYERFRDIKLRGRYVEERLRRKTSLDRYI